MGHDEHGKEYEENGEEYEEHGEEYDEEYDELSERRWAARRDLERFWGGEPLQDALPACGSRGSRTLLSVEASLICPVSTRYSVCLVSAL